MLTLALLRHAKSSWDTNALDDFARPLAERGRKAAPLMGGYLAAEGLRPDLILCSSAIRTRQTLDLVAPFLGTPRPAVAYVDGLYLASASDLIARLRVVPQRWHTVLMIGHNPGFHDLALALTASGDAEGIANLRPKFPTSALAVFTFDHILWSRLAPHTGQLTHFATPASLRLASSAPERTP